MRYFILTTLAAIFVFNVNAQTDNCGAGAPVLSVNAACSNTSFAVNENGQPEAGVTNAPCGAGTASSDEWFQFVGTGNSVQISISGINRTMTATVYTSCVSGLVGCVLVPNGSSGSLIVPTTLGVTYYVQLQRWGGGNNANLSGNICLTTVSGGVPVNNNCSTATPLPVGASCAVTNTTNLNATNSGVANPGCGSYSGGDVWFSFVAPASGSVSIESFANSMTDGAMALYSGTCASLTLLACDDDGGAGLMPSISSAVTPGATYYIRFWEYGNNNQGTFGICVVGGVAASGNQNCATGTQVCNDASFSGNSNGFATQELNAGNQGCLSTEHQSSWYYFQTTLAGTIDLSINPSSGVDYDFAIWGPNVGCGSLGAPLRCSFASGFSTSIETGSYNTGIANSVPGAAGNILGPTDGTTPDDLDGWVSRLTVLPGQTYIMLIDNFSADGTAFTLDWTFSTPGLLNCVPIVLPVEFTELVGYSFKGYNVLNWQTATELNNDYFTLERSVDLENWQVIHYENGALNSSVEMNYAYTDRSFTKNHVNYYRLSQTDTDGNTKVLRTVSIDNNVENKTVDRIVDITGRTIDSNTQGLQIILYTDGSSEKVYKK